MPSSSWRRRVVGLAAAALLAGGCAGTDGARGDREVVVLGAASLTEAFTELGAMYEAAHPDSSVTFSFGGSSAVVRQALDGADADVLATASQPTMRVAEDGSVTSGTPQLFAANSLALVVPPGNPGEVRGLADLTDSDRVVVLCAPAVPCGAAAAEAFAVAGLIPAPDSEESDVKAVLAKVAAGEADAGVVYVSDVRAAGDAVGVVDLPPAQRIVTEYPIVALASGDPEKSAGFIDLVLSPAGRQVLTSYGFEVP